MLTLWLPGCITFLLFPNINAFLVRTIARVSFKRLASVSLLNFVKNDISLPMNLCGTFLCKSEILLKYPFIKIKF